MRAGMRALAWVLGLSVLLGAVPATAGQADYEKAYQEARKLYYALRASEQKQKFRHNWHNAAKRFEAVAEKYPDSPRADDALFTAGRLYYELYAISRVQADLDAAVALFTRLADDYRDSPLADDGLMYVALQWIEYRKEPERAVADLAVLIERFPKGDVTPKARRMLQDLGGPEADDAKPDKTPRAAAKPAPGPEGHPAAEPAQPAAAEANADRGPVVLTKVRSDSGPDYTRVTLHTRTKPEYKYGIVPAKDEGEPTRLYIDLQGAEMDPDLKRTIPVSDSVVSRIRVAQFSKDVIRVVLDLKTLGEYKVIPMDHPSRVVVDVSAGSDEVARIIGQKETKKPTPPPRKKPKPRVPSKKVSKPGQSLSMLAGLKIRRVVVDPGHGGRDPGAIGPKKTLEKEVVLDIAKRLVKLLEGDKSLGLKEVILTRKRDRFVPLEKRTAIANSKKADLFISIHCNAHRNRKFHGVETFYLDLTNDRYSIKLAARENATSEKTISDLQYILADLALKSHVDDSISLGRAIQKATVGKLRRKYKRIKDMHLKPALFYVLIGARMPSVLVETSFISNPEEERRLRTKAYRQRLAEGIHAGVRNFIRAREKALDPDS